MFQSTEEREVRLHQLQVKRAKLELTNDAAFKFWSCVSPIVEQISESDHVTIKTPLFNEKFDAKYSPTEMITKFTDKLSQQVHSYTTGSHQCTSLTLGAHAQRGLQ